MDVNISPIVVCALFSIAWALPASADDHDEDANRDGVESQQEMDDEARKRYERKVEIKVRTEELEELARALSANSLELMELQNLGPEISAAVSQALIIEDRPHLGINIGAVSADGQSRGGVQVLGVTPDGPADVGGVEAGDVIVAIADASLLEAEPGAAQEILLSVLSEQEAGEPLVLSIDRNGDVQNVEVIPKRAAIRSFRGGPGGFAWNSDMPMRMDFDVMDFYVNGAQRQWDGVELIELTEGLGRYFGASDGLLVVRIAEPADELPLEEGDVIQMIDKRVPKSVGHAMRILRSYDVGETLEVQVLREKRKRNLEITVQERSGA